MSEEKVYVYIVSDKYSGICLDRATVIKQTPKTVTLAEKLFVFRWNTRVSKDKVSWTPQGAVDAWIAAKEREIEGHKNSIQSLRSSIGQMPHVLKTFQTGLELEAEKLRKEAAE